MKDIRLFQKIKQLVIYCLFIIIFYFTSQWVPVRLFLSSLVQTKAPVTIIQDNFITNLIHAKTGLVINSIKISESPHPFGMMVGIPTKPQLFLSRGLYDSFSSAEIEYVALHEAGHYLLWHSAVELVFAILFIILGILLLRKLKKFNQALIASILLGLTLAILLIQIGKRSELQADNFAVKHISNPNGMIEATNKFRNYHGKHFSENNIPLLQFLFYRANPYANRIKMAKDEINLRSN